jgi:phosphate transport system substrate-binding protein
MSIMTGILRAAALAISIAAGIPAAHALDISGAGATFPYPIYAKWADAYKRQTDLNLNYQSIGSGGGIKQIKARTVTFGASDKPLEHKELQESGLVQFPMIMGGVVPVINVKGIEPGKLALDGPTLAKIFIGDITKWDDPAIQKLNPSAKLPNKAIAVVHRSDGSGTTFLFTDYLSKVSPEWKEKVGYDTAVQWPVGIGGKGNEGVANMATQTDGSIGYVEYAYAKQNKMSYAALVNSAGKRVEPEIATFQAAASNADWAGTPGYAVILTNEPGPESWPITGASFILMHEKPQDPGAAKAALSFFDWAYRNGDQMAEELDYVPMPERVKELVRATWSKDIKKSEGTPVWQASD